MTTLKNTESYQDRIEQGNVLLITCSSGGSCLIELYAGSTRLKLLAMGASESLVFGPFLVPVSVSVICFTDSVTITETQAAGALAFLAGNVRGDSLFSRYDASTIQAWENLRLPAQSIALPGALTDPARDSTTGLISFSGSADAILSGAVELPHNWARGTAIRPDLRLIFPTSNTGKNTRWTLGYDIASPGSAFANTYGTYTALTAITISNPANAKKHVLASFGTIDTSAAIEGACLLWQLSRLADSDELDDDTNACILVSLNFRYLVEKLGTYLETPAA